MKSAEHCRGTSLPRTGCKQRESRQGNKSYRIRKKSLDILTAFYTLPLSRVLLVVQDFLVFHFFTRATY